MISMRIKVWVLFVFAGVAGLGQDSGFEQAFQAPVDGEAVAVVHASCADCRWGQDGREAAAVRVLVDGKYSQHLLLARGSDDSDYRVTLGPVAKGGHTIRI